MSCYDQKNEEVCKRTTFFIHGEYILDCCREMFHYDCLLDWLQEHNCCPVCFKEDLVGHVSTLTKGSTAIDRAFFDWIRRAV